MSYTSGLQFINCDRNILLRLDWQDSGSYRQFNWIDADGSASGRGTRTVIGPALPDNWWRVGNNNCTLQVGVCLQLYIVYMYMFTYIDIPILRHTYTFI